MDKAVISTYLDFQPGTYDLKLWYFDEDDGAAKVTVKIDGVAVDSWTWDKDLGSSLAGVKTLTSYTIAGVNIDRGSIVTIEGTPVKDEPLRIDRLDLIASGNTTPPSTEVVATPTKLPSFPGAEGFGATTAGGRGGAIVKVTNLNDSGAGSLRWALEDLDTPRIVIFDVGGIVNLKDAIQVNGDVTVAGQTAPGDGVTIRGGRLQVVDDDVIIRGLKFRPGDGSGQEADKRDGISVGISRTVVERVVIDSNSMTWAIDENASVWSGARDVTYSNNIIAEGLYDSIHPEGDHSMGMLIGDMAQRITVINNLFAHNMFRNPTAKDAVSVEVINNLIYNYGGTGLNVPNGADTATKLHAIGNHFIAGKDSAGRPPIQLDERDFGSAYYLFDNLTPQRTSSTQLQTAAAQGDALSLVKSSLVFTSSGADAMAAKLVKDYVLSHAGARTGGWLDETDARIVNSVKSGTGGLVDSPSDVGGYKAETVRTSLKDTDSDGIPDIYESKLGFNPTTFDAHGDRDKDGYTNIEEYINGLISQDVLI